MINSFELTSSKGKRKKYDVEVPPPSNFPSSSYLNNSLDNEKHITLSTSKITHTNSTPITPRSSSLDISGDIMGLQNKVQPKELSTWDEQDEDIKSNTYVANAGDMEIG